MQIGRGRSGVIVGEYGCSNNLGGQDVSEETPDSQGTLGWIEPACEGRQWILWFTEKGDGYLYTKREESGAVIGDPIILKAR